MSVETDTSLANLSLAVRRLPPPQDIRIQYTKMSGQCVVTWDKLLGADHPVFYNIYRAISSNGIFYKKNTSPIPITKFIDTGLGNNPNITYWYKVSSTYKVNNIWIEGKSSNPVQYEMNKTIPFWFNKINERNMWILKNDGIIMDFYSRKYEGEFCTECYDSLRGRAGNGACPVCYGTGFVGGYSPECQLLVRLNTYTENLTINREAYSYQQSPAGWTITPIRLRNRDLLIYPDGTIYQVLENTVSITSGVWFHQDIKLKSFDNGDPIYKMKRTNLKLAY